jgi:hypothetical protein
VEKAHALAESLGETFFPVGTIYVHGKDAKDKQQYSRNIID